MTTAGTSLPHTVLGMLNTGPIQFSFIVLPEVQDGLDVAVFIVRRHGLVADVKQPHLLLSNHGHELVRERGHEVK